MKERPAQQQLSERHPASSAPGSHSQRVPGPGLRAALTALGETGERIGRHWASADLMELEAECAVAELEVPGAKWSDESRPGTRWRIYGRTGVACSVLRREAARRRRSARDDSRR